MRFKPMPQYREGALLGAVRDGLSWLLNYLPPVKTLLPRDAL